MSKQKSKVKSQTAVKEQHKYQMAFDRNNYKWMLIGLAVITFGFILMAGRTDDLFNNGEIFRGADVSFSTKLKVTFAPIIVLLGFVIEVYAILKKPNIADEPS